MTDLTPLARLRKAAKMDRSSFCAGEINEIVEQAHEALWINLLDGVSYNPTAFSDEGERVGDLIPGPALYAIRASIQRRYDHALRALLAGAPAWVEKAVALRESVTSLCLRGPTGDKVYGLDLSTLPGFPRLSRVLVRGALRVEDLRPLADVASLRTLRFEDTEVEDLAALGGCAQIESLDLDSLHVADFKLIAKMTSLRSLRLRRVGVLRSLDGLGALPSLESLVIDKVVTGAESVTSLAALAGANSLKHLEIKGLSTLSDVRALASLPSLDALSLTDATSLTDLSALASCASLRALDLRGCSAVADVASLAQTPLRALLLAGTKVKMAAVPEGLRAVTHHRKDGTLQHADVEVRRKEAKAARPEGLHLSEWPTWPKLEALLFGKEPDNVNLGVELTAALDDARLYDAMLYGVHWTAPAQRPARRFKLDPTLAGLTPDDSSELPRSPPAMRERVLRAILDLAPDGCDGVQALREGATAVDLDGYVSPDEMLVIDASPLRRMPNVAKLGISRATSVENLDVLAGLPALRSLEIVDVGPVDLAGIDALPGLTSLRLERVPDAGLPDFVGCASLESLQIANLRPPTGSVGYYPPLTQRRTLRIGDAPRLRVLDIGSMPYVRELEVFDCPALTNITLTDVWELQLSIARAPSLQRLNVSFYGDHVSVTADSLDAVETLSIRHGNHLGPLLSRLAGSTRLVELALIRCYEPVDAATLSMLAAIPTLRTLRLAFCKVEDVSPLAAATALESLDLTGCAGVKGHAVLDALPKLNSLWLQGTGVRQKELSERLRLMLRR